MPAQSTQARDEDPDKTPVERGRDLERDSERARKRYHSTLVGHPTDGAAAPPVPAGSVLSPPRWRGAQAYQGGDDPQPQVSSLPAPVGVPQPPPLPAADARPVIGPDGKPITRVSSPPPAPPSEPLGERIEELLDGQASVPMDEVEERRSSVTELAIEDVIEAFSDPDLEPAPVVSPPPAPAHRGDLRGPHRPPRGQHRQ
ncbi:MAG: hypothetical protein OXT09_18835, partial [Myxococcales bacterium]|nr:hypothetical protein [Myxococcales bacterium]